MMEIDLDGEGFDVVEIAGLGHADDFEFTVEDVWEEETETETELWDTAVSHGSHSHRTGVGGFSGFGWGTERGGMLVAAATAALIVLALAAQTLLRRPSRPAGRLLLLVRKAETSTRTGVGDVLGPLGEAVEALEHAAAATTVKGGQQQGRGAVPVPLEEVLAALAVAVGCAAAPLCRDPGTPPSMELAGRQSKALLHGLEALLKRLAALVTAVAAAARSHKRRGGTNLSAYMGEMRDEEALLELAVAVEQAQGAVQATLSSHVSNALRKTVFDLQGDLQEAEQLWEAARQQAGGWDLGGLHSHSVAAPLELEVLGRRLTANAEVLRVYDRYREHEGLRARVAAFVQIMHAAEDGARAAQMRLHQQQHQQQQAITSGGAAGELAAAVVAADDFAAPSNVTVRAGAGTGTPAKDSGAGAQLSEAGAALQVATTATATGSIVTTGTGTAITTGIDLSPSSAREVRQREFATKQTRLDLRHQAQRDAEERYRQDEQAELEEKTRQTAIAVQRGMLRNSDSARLLDRSQKLVEVFQAKLHTRYRADWVAFLLSALLSAVVYSAVTFGCGDDRRTLGALLLDKAAQACTCLADESASASTGAGEGAGAAASLSFVEQAFQTGVAGLGVLQGLRKAATWSAMQMAENALGLQLAELGELGALGVCCGRLLLGAVVPVLLARLLAFFLGLAFLPAATFLGYLLYRAGLPSLGLDGSSSGSGSLQSFVCLLAAQGALYVLVRHFDRRVRWNVWSGDRDRSSNIPANWRPALLHLLYPAACVFAALLVACDSPTVGFSKGLRVGYKSSDFGFVLCAAAAARKCFAS